MNQLQITTTPYTIPAATRMGHVHYTTADLDRQIAFYRDILGFTLHWHEDGAAGLGAGGEDLLRLTENRDAKPVRGTTGLYHTAFLVPTRRDLAHLLRRIAETRTPIQGMTDHGTHHAIYLPDAEGNGIELAYDFPRERWPSSFAEMLNSNRYLPPETVFSVLADDDTSWEGLPPETTVGHVHLHVSQVTDAETFYHDLLGFSYTLVQPGDPGLPPQIAETARFLAAGDYHHHLGANTWQGAGAPPPPDNATGLRYFRVVLPDDEALKALVARLDQNGVFAEETPDGLLVRDPSQNGVMLTSE